MLLSSDTKWMSYETLRAYVRVSSESEMNTWSNISLTSTNWNGLTISLFDYESTSIDSHPLFVQTDAETYCVRFTAIATTKCKCQDENWSNQFMSIGWSVTVSVLSIVCWFLLLVSRSNKSQIVQSIWVIIWTAVLVCVIVMYLWKIKEWISPHRHVFRTHSTDIHS